MLKTLKNAWRTPELRKKLLFTLLIIVIYRLGANIPVPYIDAEQLKSVSDNFGGTILQFLNMLSGEALGKATLFALGVSPYITSSIVMQLLTIAIPALERLSKNGEEGRKKITAITRFVTVALALVTSIGYLMYLESVGIFVSTGKDGGGLYFFQKVIIVACYCAGAALVMWLAEKINDHGIGNGISMILFANIIAGAYSMLSSLWYTVFPTGSASSFKWQGLLVAIGVIALFLGFILLVVWMSDAERRIPIQYAKRVVGRKMYGGQNTNLPIKVNMTGVMPIIFANSIVSLPATIASFFGTAENGFTKFMTNLINGSWGFVNNIENTTVKTVVQSLISFNYNGWLYLVILLALLIAFAYFYVAISFNPVEVANNIKNNGGAIPGIRSGKPTVEYIKKVLNRITLVGALIVAFIACFPLLLNIVCGYVDTALVSASKSALFGQSLLTLAFSGSSIMIVVGVALETVRELEAQLSLRNYKGFLD